MNTPAKLGGYVLGLAVVFGGAWGVGAATGGSGAPPAPAGHTAHATPTPATPVTPAPAPVPGGLQVSQHGYTLVPLRTGLPPGQATDLRFRVLGPDGEPVTGYQVRHGKKLHLIVVSRDLAHFQHLHPELRPDGTWQVRLTLPEAGAYRMFADFAPEGGGDLTLGTDLHAAGDFAPRPLPPASRTATVDGYAVRLDGELTPGRSSTLTLTVTKDGAPVTDLQPYLGAYGHLVALRAGDLAYLHVHPDGEPGDGRTRPGPEIVFHAEVPSAGAYRLFLDFQHAGAVRTADFTLATGPGAAGGTAGPAHDDGHGH